MTLEPSPVFMGANVTDELRRRGIPMEAVKLAICTHPHGDHTDGVIQFADLLNWYFKKADPRILLPDERLRLTAIPTQHCENSYAFLIEAEGKRILFTGDLCHPAVDFPQIAFETELDLLVCELAHFSPADCVTAFDKTKAKRVLHTHINDNRWAAALHEQLNKPHPYVYGAAFDGLELTL